MAQRSISGKRQKKYYKTSYETVRVSVNQTASMFENVSKKLKSVNENGGRKFSLHLPPCVCLCTGHRPLEFVLSIYLFLDTNYLHQLKVKRIGIGRLRSPLFCNFIVFYPSKDKRSKCKSLTHSLVVWRIKYDSLVILPHAIHKTF